MDMTSCCEFWGMKKLILCVVVMVLWGVSEANYVMTPMQQRICSNECTKWTPKHCWDGYLKRKVWRMVCEKANIKCCPGYEGPKCEKECFNCDRINVFDRRFVEIYRKITTLEETCSNRTIIINGSTNTGGKLTQNCTCPAGPRGDRGVVGPVGTPGVPGMQGFQGPQGPAGELGFPGSPGPQGLDGMPGGEGRRGMIGLSGVKGDSGSPGKPGLPGRRGGKGESGFNGLQGLQGVRGEPGLPGTASAKGDQGLTGNPGFPGDRGPTGPKGDRGIDGFSGRSGHKGERGDIGFPGEMGLNGSPGPRGDVGLPGREGRAGVNGVDGSYGQKGAPGMPGLDGRPGDITRVEESRVIKELQNTIQHLVTRLETTTKEVKELRITSDKIIGCRFNCTADSFMCSCGMCILNKFRCDGFPQCPDGSDEVESECDYICSIADFKCESSGLCIPLNQKCNGVVNCADGSDESSKYCRATINCNEGNVPCRDGSKCVAREERCDGKADCADGSDEEKCVCRRDQFECTSGEECIPETSVCDAIPDCLDESDESSSLCITDLLCPEGQLSCKDNKACVNERQFCDGIKHCYDGSDEDEVTCGCISNGVIYSCATEHAVTVLERADNSNMNSADTLVVNSAQCNHHGAIGTTGQCVCEPDYFGKNCECESTSWMSDADSAISSCTPHYGSSSLCSGRGECICGICSCFPLRHSSTQRYSGRYCDCDDYSCSYHNNMICGGHGTCSCGNCECEAGYKGDACECPVSHATCVSSNGQICNGEGECVCGVCTCNARSDYKGPTCEDCPTCPGACQKYKDCVLCKVFMSGTLSGRECYESCPHVNIVDALDEEEIKRDDDTNLCQFQDPHDDQMFFFTYTWLENNVIQLDVQRTKIKPMS